MASRWRTSLRWVAMCLIILVPVAAVAGFLFCPLPEDVFEEMWEVRGELRQSIQRGAMNESLDHVDRWRTLTDRLPFVARVRGAELNLSIRHALVELRRDLGRLDAALSSGDSDTAMDRAAECFDAHLRCVDAFSRTKLPPGGQASVAHAQSHATGQMGGGSGHKHGTIEWNKALPTPTAELIAHRDPKSGWNLQLLVTNYKFAPRHASGAHIDGEGHCHLYVDDAKITRLYGEWYHLAPLSPGRHEIKVTLSANTHDEYALDGNVLAATAIVDVPDEVKNHKPMKRDHAAKQGISESNPVVPPADLKSK